MIHLQVNGDKVSVDVEPDTPLLWVLRDHLGLTGTKYGCGIGLCGACTVHLDGAAVRSCTMPVSAVGEAAVVTIEGLGAGNLHPVQQAWIDAQVPQCGYCQSGFIMAAASLLEQNPRAAEADVRAALTNLCRCGTYPRMLDAMLAAGKRREGR
jgi:isoquinoline 1-oxidoreductase alpha subunit